MTLSHSEPVLTGGEDSPRYTAFMPDGEAGCVASRWRGAF
jgi:hypothetical protein